MVSMILRLLLVCLTLAALTGTPAFANPTPFDLSGPGLRVSVTRGGTTLPIAQVPTLSAGDRIAIAADLPADQAQHYELVAAFLRGATNPPPKSWFFRAETWQRKKNTLSLTIPDGARQLVVFLAPETGGGFDAIVSGVRKQPGAFVRASQELNQASLDRARLDTFLDSLRRLERTDPQRIESVSPVLTRSLSVRLKAECLVLAAELQAACLSESRDSLLLADSHSSSLAETLVGAPTDLALQLSATPQGGYGYYSPYIGVVRDLARIFGAFQSTQFQYIPALARARDEQVALLLNAAPSFAKPKSVIVAALPAIEPAQAPPLRRAGADQPVCATRRDLLLPVEGVPLIYATRYAHDMVLRLVTPGGGTTDLPVDADPERGGYVLAQQGMRTAGLGGGIDATLHGIWGFTPFDGPRFRLENPQAGGWHVTGEDAASLVVGRDNVLTIEGASGSCIDGIALRQASGATQAVTWKPAGPNAITVTLPLAQFAPGKLSLTVTSQGLDAPDTIALTALAEVGRFDAFTLHAGDTAGVLTGTRLDLVASVNVDGTVFTPGALTRAGKTDQLTLATGTAPWTVGQQKTARIALADGRTRTVGFTVAAARPVVTLVDTSVTPAPQAGGLALTLPAKGAVPQDARLNFSFRAADPLRFTGQERVEIATTDGRASATVAAGSGFTIQDDRVAVASVEPGKALGASAYGPLRFRVVRDDVAGAWTPLATLVREPTIAALDCKAKAEPCTLSGSDLFLIDAVASNAGFTDAVAVPEGFTGTTLRVPRPGAGTLFVRLRDDRSVIARVAIPTG